MDSSVSEASPHIANIGRMIEVKAPSAILSLWEVSTFYY